MKLVLDNNSLFSIMNPNSVSAYLFLSIKAEFFAPELIKSEFDKYKESQKILEKENSLKEIEQDIKKLKNITSLSR